MTGWLVFIFMALNVIDVGLTVKLLKMGGTELNPLLSALDDWALVKLSVAFLVAIVCYWRGARGVLVGLVVGMSLVVAWNTFMLVGG